MKKDKNTNEPVIAQNPTDTVMVNVGEEITDNVVQKEQEADIVENVTELEAVQPTEDVVQAENVAEEEEPSLEEVTGRTLSPGRIVLKRFFRSKLSMTGLVILVLLFIFSFFGPLFDFIPFIWGEQESDYSNSVTEEYATPVTIGPTTSSEYAVYDPTEGGSNTVYIINVSRPSNYLKPSGTHLLGTDDKGYDILSRLMYGGRISLTIGFVVVILETVLGVLLGG